MAFRRLCILDEFECHPGAIGAMTLDGFDGVEKDADRMPSANRIPVFLEITEDKSNLIP